MASPTSQAGDGKIGENLLKLVGAIIAIIVLKWISDLLFGDSSSADTSEDMATPIALETTPPPATVATSSPSPRSASTQTATATTSGPTPAPEQATSAAPEAAQDDTSEAWTVTGIVDGDTIDVSRNGTTERVRLVGIDTPERGECGYDEATVHLHEMIGGEDVALVTAGPNTDNRDAYERLLRYVDQGELDAGYEQIDAGLAIARYDSRDGYGAHEREAEYIAADESTGEGYTCQVAEPESEPEPEPEPDPPAAEPWNQPGPDLDCADIGMRVRITGPDYHRLDADNDGWGCDSYG